MTAVTASGTRRSGTLRAGHPGHRWVTAGWFLGDSLGLDRGDRHGVDDVGDQRSAGQVVDRLVQALQHRPDGHRVRAALHRLVGVVAGVQVREDQHGGPPGHLRLRQLRRRRPSGRPPRRTGSAPRPADRAAARWTISVASLTLSTSAPLPDVPVEYDSMATRGVDPELGGGAGRGDRDVRQLLRGRVRVDRAVPVDQHPIRQAHQEDAGHDRRPRRRLDDLEGRPDGVRGGVHGAADHPVGQPEMDHHGAEIRGVGDDLGGLLLASCPCAREFWRIPWRTSRPVPDRSGTGSSRR